jgi:hypothetical protein
MLIAGIWIYWSAFHGAWVWDDLDLIPHDENLRNLHGLRNIWCSTPISNYWPLTWTLLWIEWHIWGEHPFAYHLINFALHLACAFLVWRALSKMGLRWSWLAALIFAIHPLAVESVAWISETKNTLSLMFFLLSLISYINFDNTQNRVRYLLSLLCYLLALLSKTSVVMLPAILLLYNWWKGKRISWRVAGTLMPFVAIGLVLGSITLLFE